MDVNFSDKSIAQLSAKAGQAADLLGAMANPVRLLLLCTMLKREHTVNELVAVTDLSQSAVSQHLAKLRALKLVNARRDGQQIHYCVASDEVRAVLQTLYGIYCA
jgi:ArsR family transcriptional regulator, virulence genes transcriptional regulator